MKRLLAIMTVLLFASAAYSAEAKIGIVDVQRALNDSNEGKKAKTELEGIIKKRQSEIDQKMLAKDRLAQEIEKQALILKEDALSKKEHELETLERDLDRLIADSNTELQKLQRDKEMAIIKELDVLITNLGMEGGYTVILPSEAVIYFGEGIDVTEKVIELFNKSKEQKGKDAPK